MFCIVRRSYTRNPGGIKLVRRQGDAAGAALAVASGWNVSRHRRGYMRSAEAHGLGLWRFGLAILRGSMLHFLDKMFAGVRWMLSLQAGKTVIQKTKIFGRCIGKSALQCFVMDMI